MPSRRIASPLFSKGWAQLLMCGMQVPTRTGDKSNQISYSLVWLLLSANIARKGEVYRHYESSPRLGWQCSSML
ncbi:uncharacterized protein F4812DRAFT_416166 [Daldinia caldariorum]|uniref:uncharacterized protein n=1 Tax=Daldinia caldariorum TaxID=326644 RepID=UPI002007E3A8|nr:uncharacterized protein F4812DRAFT_416166 [Daldinia caldariorum]KAI1471954.1 hypothetical protein F4812DRAFT_416166 [Daldinia caldariorum]